MNFKAVTIEDKKIMEPYLVSNPYGICDFSFANIFIWQETYHTSYTIHKDFLILQSAPKGKTPAFLMPLGQGDLGAVLKDLSAFARESFGAFKMLSITEQMAGEITPLLPDDFSVHNDNAFCDYIYLSENMIHLIGKKLSAKRNHINKFLSLYEDYEYVEIAEDNLAQCREVNNKWCQERGCNKTETDFCAVSKALDNWTALGIKGGGLIVNGEMAAFTFGQPNNSEVFDIIIEKALATVEGAYPMINREFATRECANYPYINREEDMGLEGLKKAKLSYHPYKLLYKGMGVLA